MTNPKDLAEKIHQISRETGYPIRYKTDLDIDLNVIGRFPGKKLILLLREDGSACVPLNIGCDPISVTYWEKYKKFVFFVDTRLGCIKPIPYEQAKTLLNEPPQNLTKSMSSHELRNAVNAVLKFGCDHAIWGVFNPPKYENFQNWEQWRNYFLGCDNSVMSGYMHSAIKLANSKRDRVA